MNLMHNQDIAKLVVGQDPLKQLISLNSLLAKLTRSNCLGDSLHLFKRIISDNWLRPDQYTLSTILTATANVSNITIGKQLHAYALHTGLKLHSHVANTLLSLYSKSNDLISVKKAFGEIQSPDVYSWTTLLSACTKLGDVEFACKLLDELPSRDVALWNAVITGCAGNGNQHVAIDLFTKMNATGLGYDNYTLASVLSLCSSASLDLGRQIHALIFKGGFLFGTSVLNSLLSMYFTCGKAADAYEAFNGVDFPVRDQITYNTMINGVVSLGMDGESVRIFKEMLQFGLRPTKLTFVSIMSSCLPMGVCLQVHGQAIKLGHQPCTAVSNVAMAMYIDLEELNVARTLFDGLEDKDLISWNTMMMGYAQNGLSQLAVFTYQQMQSAGIAPDEYTMGSLIASSECLEVVEMLHAISYKFGLTLISEVANALISSLSKHGDINQAYQVFCSTKSKNLISWNAIISGFMLNGSPLQGLEKFSEFMNSKLTPDAYTLTIILTICASIPSLSHGKEVHAYILKFGLQDPTLSNALIALYSKCGVFNWSVKVFNGMIIKNTVSWNAIISAFAQHGEGNKAVELFCKMKSDTGSSPDHTTFTAVLSACSHTGLVEAGISVFSSMVNDYGFEPGEDHFSCVVDLLSRAGYLNETENLIEERNFGLDSNVWWALFSACVTYGNVRLGRSVAGYLAQTEPTNPAVYVMLSNIYATAGQWQEAEKMREVMKSIGVLKQPGCTWSRF